MEIKRQNTVSERRRVDETKSLIDYIAVDERLRKDVLDAKVVRGALEGSDHYAVVIKIMVRDKWEFCRSIGREKRSKVLAKERLGREEVKCLSHLDDLENVWLAYGKRWHMPNSSFFGSSSTNAARTYACRMGSVRLAK